MQFRVRPLSQLVALLFIEAMAFASDVGPNSASIGPDHTSLRGADARMPDSLAEFQFVRLIYTDNGTSFNAGERWFTDAPAAEQHLIGGIGRLSRIDIAKQAGYIAIMDDRLFDHPWVYAVEVGGWVLSDAECARLREYLLRGGLLVVDDFHGSIEWATFMDGMRRIFPDRTVVDIPPTDSVFHIAYDLDDHVQIPGLAALSRGVTYEHDGYRPHWRGVYDDHGHLMVIINFNMDLGDAWELADEPGYPVHYTASAYKYAVNYVLYSMTH